MPRINPRAAAVKAVSKAASEISQSTPTPSTPISTMINQRSIPAEATEELAAFRSKAPKPKPEPTPPRQRPSPPWSPQAREKKSPPPQSTPIDFSNFLPRSHFEISTSLPRSYFLGHHNAALTRMRQALSNVGLILEVRDFRVPISSWNPLLEQSLSSTSAGVPRARIIVYTKRDLAPPQRRPLPGSQAPGDVIRTLKSFHRPSKVDNVKDMIFLGMGAHSASLQGLLKAIKEVAREMDSLTGLRVMVVGMPNAGKSTLLNRLRSHSLKLGKAAKTGAQPGVTRKLGTPVRILPGEDSNDPDSEGLGEGVFIVDTPGVFVPYVSEPEAMLKLALVGCVKDGIISSVTVADYLLYRLNLTRSGVYVERFGMPGPTNDVHQFLRAAARRTGKLKRGGDESLEHAADWVIQEWRRGNLGRLLLDEVTPTRLEEALQLAREPSLSMNQARKREKLARKERNEAKRAGVAGESA
ncbi:P-loop containing nucleoside triphosphate hydrolase protein [Apiosordaria backusii]|uniref:P-loop containing nucleoside triphosphate hydrolase protein n=1 Tax=Apiosordaria backusii TaxID=314023 RepID=A0AA40E4L2_9PEZI|nr:P-loop containing nucleoside triphosphate hydrolase protein [Apiosordaria backusii]